MRREYILKDELSKIIDDCHKKLGDPRFPQHEWLIALRCYERVWNMMERLGI